MGIVEALLANSSLALANRIAPVISCSILIGYVLGNRRVGLVMGSELPDDQKSVLEGRMSALERKNYWELGGG